MRCSARSRPPGAAGRGTERHKKKAEPTDSPGTGPPQPPRDRGGFPREAPALTAGQARPRAEPGAQGALAPSTAQPRCRCRGALLLAGGVPVPCPVSR